MLDNNNYLIHNLQIEIGVQCNIYLHSLPTCSPLVKASFCLFLSRRRILAFRQAGLLGSTPTPGASKRENKNII